MKLYESLPEWLQFSITISMFGIVIGLAILGAYIYDSLRTINILTILSGI